MAVTHIDSTVLNEANPTTSGTITISSLTLTDDDIYVEVMSKGHTSGMGFVTVTDNDGTGNLWTREGSSGTRKSNVFWKKATAATASKTITISSANTALAAGASVYRGGAAGDPTADLIFESNISGDESQTALTPTNQDSMIAFTVFNNAGNNTVTSQACTTPGTLTQRFEVLNSLNCAVNHSSAPQVGAAVTTGAINWAQANNATESGAWTIKAAATRFYFTRVASGESPAPVLPAIDAGWNSVQGGSLQSCRASKALVETLGGFGSLGGLLGTTSTSNICFGQWVSGPLDVNQTISGTVNVVQLVLEAGAAENAHLAFALRVVSVDGTVVRGTLATKYVTATEFNTSSETRSWSGVALTPVNALATDRLVFEIGVHAVTPANVSNVVINMGAEIGYPEFASPTDGLGGGSNGWWEIPQTITFSPYLVWGTATNSANESDVVAGAKKIILEVDTDAWVPI